LFRVYGLGFRVCSMGKNEITNEETLMEEETAQGGEIQNE
jgi:hypothetical protein